MKIETKNNITNPLNFKFTNEVVIATHNNGKVEQIKKLLEPLNWKVFSLTELGFDEDIEENGTTYSQNSFIKAEYAAKLTNIAAIGEDSGLDIDALNGAPGIYTARYKKGFPRQQRLENLLEELKDVKEEDRSARFVSVITLYLPNGDYLQAEGVCEGKISEEIINLDSGLDFAPVFITKQTGDALSKLTGDDLLAVNHRGNAFRNLVSKIDSFK